RCKLAVGVLVAEAHAEEASRASRKAAREVHADVQRERKALGFLSKAVEKIRSGTIKAVMFDQLKERIEAAAEAAHEEYCDAVKDAKPANDFAEEAMSLMETAERLYEDLEELGTAVRDRVKVVHPESNLDLGGGLEPTDTEDSLLVSALEVLLTIASNAHELASRAADNARFDMQTALEEVAKAEKIMRRVELEERRARNECDSAEGRPLEEYEPPPDCPFATWSPEMHLLSEENLSKFRKDGKYRLHLDKAVFTGTEDVLMMASLLAKVQLLRDLKNLKVEDKLEEERRQDSLMQAHSNTSKRKRTSGHRDTSAAAGVTPDSILRAPLHQQSVMNLNVSKKSGRRSVAFAGGGRRRRQRKDQDDEDRGKEEEEEEEEEDDDNEEGEDASGSTSADESKSNSSGSTSSSEVDSVFGSDLDGDDEDLKGLRRKARQSSIGGPGRRSNGNSATSMTSHGSFSTRPSSSGGATRRNEKLRRELIRHTLGKRKSIGTKALAKALAPRTP
ncbi:unnamed protein product, partial [Discosporangium mesarthrocarpum]